MKAQGRLLAAISVFFWGAAYVWGKLAMDWLSPFAASTARFGFAALIMVIITLFIDRPNRSVFRGHWLHYFLLGFIGITCFQGFLFLAVYYSSPISAAVIMALSPALTAIIEGLVTRQMPPTATILGIVISIIGAVLAILGASPQGLSNFHLNGGDIFAVIAALCFSFYTVASRRWLIKQVSLLFNVTLVVVIGAIFLLPLGLSSLPDSFPQSTVPIWALVGLILGSTVIAYLCWTRAIDQIGVSEPNLMFNFMPIVTIILYSLYGNPPTLLQLIGAFLVIAGVSWAMLSAKIRFVHKR